MCGDRQAWPEQVWDGAQRSPCRKEEEPSTLQAEAGQESSTERNLASYRTGGEEETAGRQSESAVTG